MLKCALAILALPGLLACALARDFTESCRERYRTALEARPNSSLVRFRLGECFWRVKDRAAAVNEFRRALNGDLQPAWVNVWSHLNLGKIFDATGQRQRALNEYRMARETGDNTWRAQDEIGGYLQSSYTEP